MEKSLIIGIGEVLWDILPDGRRLGGAPANFVYHAKQDGAEGFVVSAIGKDIEGEDVFREFKTRDLSIEYLAEISGHPTGTVSVKLDNCIPSYTIHKPAAWDFIPYEKRFEKLASKADAVCFGTLAQRNEVSAKTIQRFLSHCQPDCLKILDVNLRQNFFSKDIIESSLALCNILKISDEELPIITEIIGMTNDYDKVAPELTARYNLKYLILTMGGNGSFLHDGKGSYFMRAYDYGPPVDTIGCGDSFTAAFTVGLLHGLGPSEAMEHASRIAGFVCANQGATPKLPEELKINKKTRD